MGLATTLPAGGQVKIIHKNKKYIREQYAAHKYFCNCI